MSTARILIVEDEANIRRFVGIALQDEGFQVFEADSVKRALIHAASRQPDLVIVDLGLPDGDGKQLISELRGWLAVPILVLSARDREEEKVAALDAGADDYLTKPFGVPELLARIRAQLRRHGQAGTVAATSKVKFGEIEADLATHEVWRQGQPVHLTPIEYRLLCVLLANTGKVMTQRHLLREVWGPASVESNHYLRVYVGHLRQKLEDDATQPKYLLTETGVGYRFQP